ILNRARFEQGIPVSDACDRPTGDDQEEIGPLPDSGAETFRKAQVVTDEGRDLELGPLKRSNCFSGFVIVRLTAQGERVELAVTNNLFALWVVADTLIAPQTCAAIRDQTTYQIDSQRLSSIGQKALRLA